MNNIEKQKETILIDRLKRILLGKEKADDSYEFYEVRNFFRALKGQTLKRFESITTFREFLAFIQDYIPLETDLCRNLHNTIIAEYYNSDFYNQEMCLCCNYLYSTTSNKTYKKLSSDIPTYSANQNRNQGCFAKESNEPGVYGFYFEQRTLLEYNPYYAQVSVGGIIQTSDSKLLFLQCKHGDLDGKITLVQGHSSYINPRNDDFLNKFYYDLSRECATLEQMTEFNKRNMLKECSEELYDTYQKGFDAKRSITNIEHLAYMPLQLEDMTKVSAYHMGQLFRIDINIPSYCKIISGEPNKHDVIIITREEARKILSGNEKLKFDDWAKYAVEKYFEAEYAKVNKAKE